MAASCSGAKIDHYVGQEPVMDLQQFFDGELRGWGIVQDRKGNVIKRFDLHMQGRWDGNKGVLDEQFTYYDGEEQLRSWNLERRDDGVYIGTASDIVGEAIGVQSGNALNLKYQLIVPVGDSEYTFKFDDWLWRMNDGLIINRATMRKFGIRFAELTVVMQKP